ncbi:hypothetical protein [Streptomyces sp. NPDC050535]|uniref:hypothetical protein n=1 Tax=Streptomyces sp. NPDC050535 TaxID=3365626 RepID=UPI0037BAA5FF
MSETTAETTIDTGTEPVAVTLDDEQLAQLAAAVTTGLAEYLVPEPATAVPAEVTVVVPEPAEEEPAEPDGDPEETTEPSGTSIEVSGTESA